MIFRITKFSLPILVISLVLNGCKEYVAYNYDAELVASKAGVHGIISNIFTGEPVSFATVQIGLVKTVTTDDGSYILFCNFGTDEERNKPVPITVTAQNYYQYSSEIILNSFDNEMNIEMLYAAPIIKRHYGGWHLSSTDLLYRVLQAEILDYQGIDTIDSVKTTFFIRGEGKEAEIYRYMKSIKRIDNNTAFYQVYETPRTFRPWKLLEIFTIEVWDKEGFTDFASHGTAQSTPLFTPILP